MNNKLKSIFSIVLFLQLAVECAYAVDNKITVGQKAKVLIVEANTEFEGRVDTGAATTSINAHNILVSNGRLEYRIINQYGKEAKLVSELVKESFVKNAESREKRYFVDLTISYKGLTKKILVNLNDRSNSKYKLLLGRNWLAGHYIVDVDR